MDSNTLNLEVNNFLKDVFNQFDIMLTPFVDDKTNLLINDYKNQLDNQQTDMIEEYKLNNIVNSVIDDYTENNQYINVDELKNMILRTLIDIILQYQYTNNVNNQSIDFNNFEINSNKTEDLVKIHFLAHNQDTIRNLSFVGTSEMLCREILEDLKINVYPMNEEEYRYIAITKKLLRNDFHLLYSGDLNLIFNKLGKTYKENYLLNEINRYVKKLNPQHLEQLRLTEEERNLLQMNLGITLPDINKVMQEQEIQKAEEQFLEEVNYVEKDDTKYVKFQDDDEDLHFAEIVGNITPQERIERIKDEASILPKSEVIKAKDISNEIKNDMIMNGDFKSIDEVNKTDLTEEEAIGIDMMKKEGYQDMKIDTRTGLFIDEDGKPYDVNTNDDKVQIQQLNNNGITQDIQIENNPSGEVETIQKLEEYGVDKDTYIEANEEQKKQIRELYGIGKFPDENVNTNEKNNGNQFVKKIPSVNGYISSFIITFLIGAFGGMLAMVILNLSK